ncbi:MAG: beta-phosphoglucomutase [Oscillospiraceae bacterium]|nr:beta-phosphoglucomutase [Oscillospiraceae bacterium]
MDGIKAVIFDLDGVIINTDLYHYKAWKKIAGKIGVYFDEEINHKLRGISRIDSLNIILGTADFSPKDKELLTEEKNRCYIQYLRQITPAQVSAELLGALEALKGKGLKLAIGSSSRNARMILDKLDLTRRFDAISDGNDISRSKPDPEVFLNAARLLEAEPPECIVVEDAEAGIMAGRSAGMKTIAYGAAAGKYAADYYALSFRDIRSLVCG